MLKIYNDDIKKRKNRSKNQSLLLYCFKKFETIHKKTLNYSLKCTLN